MKNCKSNKLLNPLNDYLFYMVMGRKGDEYQLTGFLNAVLSKTGKQIEAIESFRKKYITAEIIGNKECILDVMVRLKDGTIINVELQIKNEGNMEKRTLYYSSKLINLSLKKGQDYKELPNIIAINIINFDYLDTDNHHTVFRLREDDEHEVILTNSLEIHFINMVKWRRMVKENYAGAPLDMWLSWLDKIKMPEKAEEAICMDSRIAAAEACLQELDNDERLRQLIEMRDKAAHDRASWLNTAMEKGLAKGIAKGLKEGRAKGLEEGRAKGLEEGRAKGLEEGRTKGLEEGRAEKLADRIESARKMKADGMAAESISKYTGLPVEEIQKL